MESESERIDFLKQKHKKAMTRLREWHSNCLKNRMNEYQDLKENFECFVEESFVKSRSLEVEIYKLTSENKRLTSEIESKLQDDTLLVLRRKIELYKSEMARIRKECDQKVRIERKDLERERNEVTELLGHMEEENANLKSIISSLQPKLLDPESEFEPLSPQKKKQKTVLHNFQEELRRKRKIIHSQNQQINDLREENHRYKLKHYFYIITMVMKKSENEKLINDINYINELVHKAITDSVKEYELNDWVLRKISPMLSNPVRNDFGLDLERNKKRRRRKRLIRKVRDDPRRERSYSIPPKMMKKL